MSAPYAPPPPARGAGGQIKPGSRIDHQATKHACNRSGCTCALCCSVDRPAPDLLRSVSPLAEYVARKALYGPRRCSCGEVA